MSIYLDMREHVIGIEITNRKYCKIHNYFDYFFLNMFLS